MITPKGHQLTAASSPPYGVVEELQFTVGEGPCLEAHTSGTPVLIADVAVDARTRWPGYAAAVLEHGVCAVFAFPLQVGAARLGALDVYQDRPGALARPAVADALRFAEVALTTLLDASRAAEEPSSPSLEEMLDGHRAELYQAQGMVMIQLEVDPTEAMVRLRGYAYAHGRPLLEVAREVVARRIVFEA